MRNPLSLLPLTALATTATAALTLNTTLLQPWQITGASTHSPSGYPANHPYSSLRFTIGDPNSIVLGQTRFGDAAFPPSAVNCTVWWMSYAAQDPREAGWLNTCEPLPNMQGKWTFRVVNGTGDQTGLGMTTDFGLSIALEEAVVLQTGGVVGVRFEGEALFRVGGNMAGTCGGSGVCNWGLKADSVPVLVKQKLVKIECVAGTCEEEGDE